MLCPYEEYFNVVYDPLRGTINQKDRLMSGRFGKYGDFKRKTRILRSRPFGKDIERSKQRAQRLKRDKRIKLQKAGRIRVSIHT